VSLVAACTSDPKESAAGENGDEQSTDAGSTRGLTDDTIKIAYLGADFGALAAAGVAPDLGNQQLVVQTFVDDINAAGGIAGRKIELDFRLLNPLKEEDGQAACLAATQDFGAFAVIAGPGVPVEVAECVAVANETLMVANLSAGDALFKAAHGRVWDLGMGQSRLLRAWAAMLDERGLLKGRIGVVTSEGPRESVAVQSALIPALKALGHTPVATVVLPCADGDSDCDQHEAAVQQLKNAGADTVLVQVAPLANGALLEAARNLDFAPVWSFAADAITDTVAKFYASSRDTLAGAVGVANFDIGPRDGSTVAPTDQQRKCNERAAEAGAAYAEDSDAYGFTGVVCQLLQLFERAADSIDGDLGQQSMIRALGEIGAFDADNPLSGSWGPDKHDGGNFAWYASYDPATGVWFRSSEEPFNASNV
jgi:hypothetical protein